jgi:predicted site-specific integrase-resolvase
MKRDDDHVILRRHLRELLGVCNETMRRWLKTGKLPPPDVNLSRRALGWRVSTLRAHGINVA